MKIICTQEQVWIKKWEKFNFQEPRGTHLQSTSWLNSYKKYGFDTELNLALDINDEIIGGFVTVIAKKFFLKFYIVPQGPIIRNGEEKVLESLLNFLSDRSKKLNCCYFQVSIPFSNHQKIKDFTYPLILKKSIPKSYKRGKKFNYIYAGYGLNWVNLKEFNDFDSYLKSLKSQTRRNMRIAYRKNDCCSQIKNNNLEEIKTLYELVQDNANSLNYNVRNFSEIDDTLITLLKTNQGIYKKVVFNEEVLSAGFSVFTGSYITYLFGGTKRVKPDRKSGYLIHAENIRTSISLGLQGYNISMGGSNGVKKFKSNFGAEEIKFEEPHYYGINNKIIFKLFQKSETILNNHKAKIAMFLKKIR